jgi:DNA-binding NtrC family response regulator
MNTMYAAVRLIGSSPSMRALEADIDAAARSNAKVLITGETGVGKDVVARLIHQRSGRASKPLATINCAGIPDTLLESELFGHVRGSFTGAVRDKPGLFEVAHHGTVFLDEAGEMSLRMQATLLRFLETGELQRVGSDSGNIRVNVRIIAATNRDLRQRIQAGEFREDLYYRLNVIQLHVPALRDRAEDIAELMQHSLRSYSEQHRLAPRTLTAEALDVLTAHRWPGNVRELKNVAERLAVRAPGEPIRARDLPEECLQPASIKVVSVASASPDAVSANVAGELVQRMTERGETFWEAVREPFIGRDLARDQLRAVVRAGLERTSGNYRLVVQLFNLPPTDYKRFLSFLRKHNCHIPFQGFRASTQSFARTPQASVSSLRSPSASFGSAGATLKQSDASYA